jgi:ABC-2 type transport system permease protein
VKTYFALVIADAKELVRDRMALFWFLAFPLIFILLFGAIFSNSDDFSKFDIGVVQEDQGPVGSSLAKAFGQVPTYTVHRGSKDSELGQLKKGNRSLVVVLPANLSQQVTSGAKGEIPVYYEPSKQQENYILLTSVNELLNQAERQITNRPMLFETQPLKVQAAHLKNIDYLLPSILAMALMQLGLFGALRLVSLRERKILKRLGATPLRRSTLIAGEVTVRLTMAIVQTITIIIVGQLAFNVKILAPWWQIFLLVLLGAATFVSLGYMLVSFAKTEESGQALVQAVQFPMMFLSGIFFPVTIMPDFLKPVIKAMPLTYLGDALRQIMTGSPPLYPLHTDLIVMAVWLGVTLLLGIKLFQWE